jgi:hypothetical protein
MPPADPAVKIGASFEQHAMATIVLQSYRTDVIAPWIQHCLASVRRWAEQQGFNYLFIGDSLFERVPLHLRERANMPLLPLTDIARLGLMREQLAAGYDRVVWVDADLLVFRPEQLIIPASDGALLCYEAWTWLDEHGRLAKTTKINNAFMVFERGHPLLDFLLRACIRLLEQRRPETTHPTLLGPMILSALANATPLDVITQVASLPPIVIADLANGVHTPLLAEFSRQHGYASHAANLCRSLLDPNDLRMNGANRVTLSDDDILRAVEGLSRTGGTLLDGGLPAASNAQSFTTLAKY